MSDARAGHERVNGADLYYEISGDGPPVVLLHGGLCHLGQWDDLSARLSRDHQVIRYDRRGHGRSSKTYEGNDMDTYASDLAQLAAIFIGGLTADFDFFAIRKN